MWKLLCLLLGLASAVVAQENALRVIPPFIHDCYESKYLLERDNRLPHTLNTLLSILRKIEDAEIYRMDIRTLSTTLLHRYRQDGIVRNPNIIIQDGVIPYAPSDYQFFQFRQTLRLISENEMTIPNNTITDVERCTLHYMLSVSTEILQRGDEGRVCRFASGAYRSARSARNESTTSKSISDDVETLSPAEIESITRQKGSGVTDSVDPNSLYPEYPLNHPHFAQIHTSLPKSECPVENGVIKTAWGPVSVGYVVAGIAAGLQPQSPTLRDLQVDDSKVKLPLDLSIDNKWFSTVTGNLAEVALMQGPTKRATEKQRFILGASGNWNSSVLPRWYFLGTNDHDEMTSAEIRGGLDGLILANKIKDLYGNVASLRLSQVLDMYYSARGVLDPTIRACNRRDLFTAVAPNETISAEAYNAAALLNDDLAEATLDPLRIKSFAVKATNELLVYIPSSMNKDLTCRDTDALNDFHQVSVDLTIILDTRWPFAEIQLILANLLDNLDINRYNSNFTLMNGHDGTFIINSTSSILEFLSFNSTGYENVSHGFDLPKAVEKLYWTERAKLDGERSRGVGGARSEVVLIVPYHSEISQQDREYCRQRLAGMREDVPDATILILAHRSKDPWAELVRDSGKDLFSISVGSAEESLQPITDLVSRIKQVPKRLINSQCGSNYESTGSSNSYTDYVEPNGVNFYRLHPNYFFNTDTTNVPTVTIEGSSTDELTVCISRELLHVNATGGSCSTTRSATTLSLSCADASLIHQCPPAYISVRVNSTSRSLQCTDNKVCRFPHLIKYTVSYNNLVCVSSAVRAALSPAVLALILAYFAFLNASSD